MQTSLVHRPRKTHIQVIKWSWQKLIYMKCLRFELETPYLANFRKPFSTITILSYSFPPYTTIRGLLANSLGLERDDYSLQDKFDISIRPLNNPARFQDMVLMKKIKSNLNKKEADIIKKLEIAAGNLSVLSCDDIEILDKLKYFRSSSAPFIKEFITPILCRVFVLGDDIEIAELKRALEDPARPLYLGASDDFVIISNIKILDAIATKCDKIDSIYRMNDDVEPTDKRKIVGRVPYKFKPINIKRRDYARVDAVVAAPTQDTKLELTEPVNCYEIGDEYVSF